LDAGPNAGLELPIFIARGGVGWMLWRTGGRAMRIRLDAVLAQAVLLFAVLVAPTALAQTEPSWNRRITSVEIVPAGGGPAAGYDLEVAWQIDLQGTSASPVALGVSIELLVNGADRGTTGSNDLLSWDVPGSSTFCLTAADGDPCGTATINGVAAQLGCEAQTATCTPPPFTTAFPGISLNAADNLAASLTPAAGAEPEAFTIDDAGALVFGSWNRRIRSLQVQSSPAGPTGTFEIAVEWVIDFQASSTLSVNFMTQTHVSDCPDEDPVCGDPVATSCCDLSCDCEDDVDGADFLSWQTGSGSCSSSSSVCGEAIIGGVLTDLTCDPDTDTCSSPAFSSAITNVSPPPSGRMLVSLLPTANALPELSADDDRQVVQFPVAVPAVSRGGVVVVSLLLASAWLMIWRRRPAR
jgi:hypothetical protein